MLDIDKDAHDIMIMILHLYYMFSYKPLKACITVCTCKRIFVIFVLRFILVIVNCKTAPPSCFYCNNLVTGI